MIAPGTIREMVDRIVNAIHPRRVVLFGSHARGDSGPDSDIDLLVIQETDLPRPKRSAPLYSLLREYPQSKDILVFTPAEVEANRALPTSLIATALREGKTLYED